jgi:hypothetical protein
MALWKSFEKNVSDKESIATLEPSAFFSKFGDPKTYQITLAQAKEYEDELKFMLESMSKITANDTVVRLNVF